MSLYPSKAKTLPTLFDFQKKKEEKILNKFFTEYRKKFKESLSIYSIPQNIKELLQLEKYLSNACTKFLEETEIEVASKIKSECDLWNGNTIIISKYHVEITKEACEILYEYKTKFIEYVTSSNNTLNPDYVQGFKDCLEHCMDIYLIKQSENANKDFDFDIVDFLLNTTKLEPI